MKTNLVWTEGMAFTAECDGKQVVMDSKPPLGKGLGMNPKELVATGLGGCTAMDVIALLKKHKQPVEGFKVSVDITPSTGPHPIIFQTIIITYEAMGEISPEVLVESVKLSQTKYCGVSAMISKATPVQYNILLNYQHIGSGQAQFAI